MAEAIINRECSSEEDSVMSVSEHEKDLEKSSKKSGKRKRKSRYDILDEKYDSLNGKLDFLTDFIGKLESRENTEVVNQQKSPTNIRNTGVFDPQKSVEKENTDLQKSPTFNFQDPEEMMTLFLWHQASKNGQILMNNFVSLLKKLSVVKTKIFSWTCSERMLSPRKMTIRKKELC